MARIALVQNQSEMSHYGYADARPLLSAHDVRLFTGDNISDLVGLLETRHYDALVIGTNALNDREILSTICTPSFASVVDKYIRAGAGVLCLQQIGLAMRKGPTLELVPPRLGQILPVVRPADESTSYGSLSFGAGDSSHIVATYPNVIDADLVERHARQFASLRGIYWHSWDGVDRTKWDYVAVDQAATVVRPLVVATKEASDGRIILSALPLDWQKHEELFDNLIIYAIDGHHHLAIIEGGTSSLSFDYLRHSIRTRRIAHATYRLPAASSAAARNLASGRHSTILLGPGVTPDTLDDAILAPLRAGVDERRLRLVDIERSLLDGTTPAVRVVSRERQPVALLQRTELLVQSELRFGYIDDSLWSHVETLQTLDALPDRLVDYAQLQGEAFRIGENHERSGSYDEMFGPTCAFYWLRARYLGTDSPEVRATSRWLREMLPEHGPVEHALYYLMHSMVSDLNQEEADYLLHLIDHVDVAATGETELLLYLRTAVAACRSEPRLAKLADALVRRQVSGVWVDLTTTASATVALLDARRLMVSPAFGQIRERVDRSALEAVAYILQTLSEASGLDGEGYAWEGKARTTTKCIQAWLCFDELQDLPVDEMIAFLSRANHSSRMLSSMATDLGVVESVSAENGRLRTENEQLALDGTETARLAADAQRRLRHVGGVITGLCAALYIAITVAVGALSADALGDALYAGFIVGWQVHAAFLGLVIAAVSLYIAGRHRNVAERDGSGT